MYIFIHTILSFPIGESHPGATLNQILSEQSQQIGGEFNEWLNITTTFGVGASLTSNGLYICEVCVSRGTEFKECHLANTSLQVIGGPPILNVATDNSKFWFKHHMHIN